MKILLFGKILCSRFFEAGNSNPSVFQPDVGSGVMRRCSSYFQGRKNIINSFSSKTHLWRFSQAENSNLSMARLGRVSRGAKVTIPYLRGQRNIETSFFVKKPFLVVFRDEEHESRYFRPHPSLRGVM